MSYAEQSDKLAGTIALCKQYVTKCSRETAEDATQIFGGRGITKTGMGKFVENVSAVSVSLGYSTAMSYSRCYRSFSIIVLHPLMRFLEARSM
jgi:alkylation response protein AidB-like acyl-CoA dehydrogenase